MEMTTRRHQLTNPVSQSKQGYSRLSLEEKIPGKSVNDVKFIVKCRGILKILIPRLNVPPTTYCKFYDETHIIPRVRLREVWGSISVVFQW